MDTEKEHVAQKKSVMPASDPADVAAINVNVVPVMQMENLGGVVDLSLPSFLGQ